MLTMTFFITSILLNDEIEMNVEADRRVYTQRPSRHREHWRVLQVNRGERSERKGCQHLINHLTDR
jgi:hypothetical protein